MAKRKSVPEAPNEVISLADAVVNKLHVTQAESIELLRQPEKVMEQLNQAQKKAAMLKDGVFKTVFDDFRLMIELVKAYVKKEYREVPGGSIVAILGGILYVALPVDVIPDMIPGVGYVDDYFVIALVLKQVHADLQAFKLWQDTQVVSLD